MAIDPVSAAAGGYVAAKAAHGAVSGAGKGIEGFTKNAEVRREVESFRKASPAVKVIGGAMAAPGMAVTAVAYAAGGAAAGAIRSAGEACKTIVKIANGDKS